MEATQVYYVCVQFYTNMFILSECEEFTYGLDCNQTCGNCSKGEQCNHVNGSCLNGCGVGMYGDKCDRGKLKNLVLLQIITE